MRNGPGALRRNWTRVCLYIMHIQSRSRNVRGMQKGFAMTHLSNQRHQKNARTQSIPQVQHLEEIRGRTRDMWGSYTAAARACWGEWRAAGSQEEEEEVRVVASMVPCWRQSVLPAETEPVHCVLPVSAHAVTTCVLTPSMYRRINNTEMWRFTKTKDSEILNVMWKGPAVAHSIRFWLKITLSCEWGDSVTL